MVLQSAFRANPNVCHSASSACKHTVSDSISLPSRGSFHLSLTVLYTIGQLVVFSLTGWTPRVHTGFLVSCATLDTALEVSISVTGLLPCFASVSTEVHLSILHQTMQSEPHSSYLEWFGLFRVRSPLLTESLFYFLFLHLLRCFSSVGSLLIHYVFMYRYRGITHGEFPHSEMYGSQDVCS